MNEVTRTQKTQIFSGDEPEYDSMTRRNFLMRASHATPIPLGGHFARSSMSRSLSVLSSDPFYDTRKISNQPVLRVEFASRGTPCRM